MFINRKVIVSAVLAAGLLIIGFTQADLSKAIAAQVGLYVVQKGDTLSEIGAEYGVSVKELKSYNHLSGTLIKIGQTLTIPESVTHNVLKGDNLSQIAQKYKTSVEVIKKANGLSQDDIYPGIKLMIPRGRDYKSAAVVTNMNYQKEMDSKSIRLVGTVEDEPILDSKGGTLSNQLVDVSRYTKEDCYLLAKLIHAEARGESMQGKIAVGAVILNRLESPDFPKTIKAIIYQQSGHVYQFSPVADGSINLEPNDAARQAARAAIAGEDPTNGSVFFYNPEIATDDWIKTLPVSTVIGNHVFAR